MKLKKTSGRRAAVFAVGAVTLAAALGMSAPAEINLANEAGFHSWTAFGAPAVLSLYSIIAALAAAFSEKGTKAKKTAMAASVAAVSIAMGAQVVSHLISSGYMSSGPWLVALISSVPALSAAHLLHVIALVPSNTDELYEAIDAELEKEGQEHDDMVEAHEMTPEGAKPKKTGGRRKVSLDQVREFMNELDVVGESVTSQKVADRFDVSLATGNRYMNQVLAA